MGLLATSASAKDPVDEFREWFNHLLKKRGLTQADAAWLLGGRDEHIHSHTVQQGAGGTAVPSYGHLITIAKAFGAPAVLTDPLRDDGGWRS